MILLTGAAGFIGSYLLGYLNKKGIKDIIIVDEFDEIEKEPNYQEKDFLEKIERKDLFDWLDKEKPKFDFVFHLGARTDTTEFDYAVHEELNLDYSRQIWVYCTAYNTPLIYASSAATYGNGEFGYLDDHDIVEKLQPLNPYGISKNEFDKWALGEPVAPPSWAGLKFFNVYGPNEYHKGRMASVIFHAYTQIMISGKVKLFRSHKPGYKDGEQLRDFIYAEDVAGVMYWMMNQFMDHNSTAGSPQRPASGLYNVGTGRARTFNDLVKAIYSALEIEPVIEYIDTPEDIRDKYQYFTEACMKKLRKAGYEQPFYSLEGGVKDYVSNFLVPNKYY